MFPTTQELFSNGCTLTLSKSPDVLNLPEHIIVIHSECLHTFALLSIQCNSGDSGLPKLPGLLSFGKNFPCMFLRSWSFNDYDLRNMHGLLFSSQIFLLSPFGQWWRWWPSWRITNLIKTQMQPKKERQKLMKKYLLSVKTNRSATWRQARPGTSTHCQKTFFLRTQVSGPQLIGASIVSTSTPSQDGAQLDKLRSILFSKSHTAERGDLQDCCWCYDDENDYKQEVSQPEASCSRNDDNEDNNDKFRSR